MCQMNKTNGQQFTSCKWELRENVVCVVAVSVPTERKNRWVHLMSNINLSKHIKRKNSMCSYLQIQICTQRTGSVAYLPRHVNTPPCLYCTFSLYLVFFYCTHCFIPAYNRCSFFLPFCFILLQPFLFSSICIFVTIINEGRGQVETLGAKNFITPMTCLHIENKPLNPLNETHRWKSLKLSVNWNLF